MTASAKIVSVLLSYNRTDRVLDCLASLKRQSYPFHDVLVVDNASKEDPAPLLRDLHPEVHLLRLEENKGFAGGMNQGICWAMEREADLVFCLNDDVTFLAGCLDRLAEAFSSRPLAGVLCPWVYTPSSPPVLYSAGVQVDGWGRTTHLMFLQSPPSVRIEPYECPAVTGCAIALTRAFLREAGGFGERFCVYYEETDLCSRALETGRQVWVVPEAGVVHHALPEDREERSYIVYLMWRNRLLYLGKRGSRTARPLWVVLREGLPRAASWAVKPRWRTRRKLIRPMLLGIWHAFTGRTGPPPPSIFRG